LDGVKSVGGERIQIVPGLVVSDPEVHEGEPVFLGTDVLVRTLIQYRDGHSPLYEFLLDFPEVRPDQARKFIEWCAEREAQGIKDVLGWLKMAARQDADSGSAGQSAIAEGGA
jgi:uncharacterized protein (DUF433 family)